MLDCRGTAKGMLGPSDHKTQGAAEGGALTLSCRLLFVNVLLAAG